MVAARHPIRCVEFLAEVNDQILHPPGVRFATVRARERDSSAAHPPPQPFRKVKEPGQDPMLPAELGHIETLGSTSTIRRRTLIGTSLPIGRIVTDSLR